VTVLLSVASQAYSAGSQSLPFTVAANATQLVVMLTHPDWPVVNPLIQYEVLWGGVSDGLTSIGGGLIQGKGGTHPGGTDALVRSVSKPPGLTSGTVRVQVFATLTTAILVESF
jgi:hypothetical protein